MIRLIIDTKVKYNTAKKSKGCYLSNSALRFNSSFERVSLRVSSGRFMIDSLLASSLGDRVIRPIVCNSGVTASELAACRPPPLNEENPPVT